MYAIGIILIVAAYLFGGISTGYYLIRFRTGKDIRDYGSGAVGARNVGRQFGAPGFIITGIGDLLKGAVPVLIAGYLDLNPWVVMFVLLAVVSGHVWPVQLGFRGGKGIATGIGGLVALNYSLVLVLLLLFVVILAVLRHITISGLTVVALSPLIAVLMGLSRPEIYTIVFLTFIVLIAHRKNLAALSEKQKRRK